MIEIPPRTIVLATDGSTDALLATKAAADLSSKFGSELHVVHVLEENSHFASHATTSEMLRRIHEQEARELLKEQVKRIEVRQGTVAQAHLREGSPAEEILDLAEELKAGLLIVGSRGLGQVERIFLGSVSDGVIHHASAPVLVMRGGEDAWPPSRLVIGDDGSEAAEKAGELAASIVSTFSVSGVLIRASLISLEADIEGDEVTIRSLDREVIRKERILEGRVAKLGAMLGSRPKIGLRVGDAAHAILEATGEDGEQERTLVAVGCRGLGMVGRMRLGSVSTKVVRLARGPVLVCPSP